MNTVLALGIQELLLVAFLVLLFFGAKKIPELMRGLGKGVKSFKKGMSDVEEEIKEVDEEIKKDDSKASK